MTAGKFWWRPRSSSVRRGIASCSSGSEWDSLQTRSPKQQRRISSLFNPTACEGWHGARFGCCWFPEMVLSSHGKLELPPHHCPCSLQQLFYSIKKKPQKECFSFKVCFFPSTSFIILNWLHSSIWTFLWRCWGFTCNICDLSPCQAGSAHRATGLQYPLRLPSAVFGNRALCIISFMSFTFKILMFSF